ncbi:MAG TPA: hypothetical protein EYG73_07675 [Arcobacter sp.]|nr:hypothetical protein [Arcobacter sp.]
MIDMRGYFTHRAYPCVVDKFKKSFDESQLNCDDYWFSFTDLQRKISNNKCPICEVELSGYPNKTNTATLDHFKPKAQNMYPQLKCEPKNYILMCSLCNSTYKEDKFPLLDERPLLFNPTEEDPLDFFELAFRYSGQGGILELKRESNISKGSYTYKRCEAMIKMFGLGYCDKDIHPNDEVKKCRIDILTKHYGMFIELAKARSSKKSLAHFFKDKNRVNELKKYGFFRFIMKEQFSIN